MRRRATLLALTLCGACSPSGKSVPSPAVPPNASPHVSDTADVTPPPEQQAAPAPAPGAWGEPDQGLQCRLLPRPSADQVLVRVELLYRGPTASHEDLALHLLLTRHVDRNHLLRFTVGSGSTNLKYVGPQPPGDIGDVEDIVLADGSTQRREVDLTSLFAWQSPGTHDVEMHYDGWTYETALPSYWTGSIRCAVQVEVPPSVIRQ